MDNQKIIWLGQKAYALAVIAVGTQQLVRGEINDNFFPGAFSSSPAYHLFAYGWGIAFTMSGIAFLLNRKAYEAALISAGVFLLLFLVAQLPFYLFVSPEGNTLIGWAAAIESIAFTGSSLIFAESLGVDVSSVSFLRPLQRLIPFGGALFSCMLIMFGIDHFVYVQFVSEMVPAWIPAHYFWTYFTGIALIGAGVAVSLRIRLKLVGSLLGTMIFLWFLFLHIPRAIEDPVSSKGLELTRVFVSFGFSGIAFLLSQTHRERRAGK